MPDGIVLGLTPPSVRSSNRATTVAFLPITVAQQIVRRYGTSISFCASVLRSSRPITPLVLIVGLPLVSYHISQ